MKSRLLIIFSIVILTACGEHSAIVKRTHYGTAHIFAKDYGSLGFGQGYAYAEDRFCILMDQIVKVRGERSKFFGPHFDNQAADQFNIASDFAYRSLALVDNAEESFLKLSIDAQDMIAGYVKGFNHYLSSTGVENLAAECNNAEWVSPITVDDLVAYYLDVAMLAGTRNFILAVGGAQPPVSVAQAQPFKNDIGPSTIANHWPHIPKEMASNGIALGNDRTSEANSLLLSNTHLPWEGELKYHEVHLNIPGEVDIAGVSIGGAVGVQIGFNRDIAWTHTTSPSNQFVIYALTLGDSPTEYVVDGERKSMIAKEITIEVKGLGALSQTMYSTEYGPVVEIPGLLGWSEQSAFAIRDLNANSIRFIDMFLAKAKAKNIDHIESIYSNIYGVPWNHTLAIDKSGEVFYTDATLVPNFNPVVEAGLVKSIANPTTPQEFLVAQAYQNNILIVDGSNSLFNLVDDPGATKPGAIPYSRAPKLKRTDYVTNSNDSYWIPNANTPFDPSDFSFFYGKTNSELLLRTRIGFDQIEDVSVTNQEGLQQLVISNRSLTADLWLSTLVNECSLNPVVANSAGVDVNLTEACGILSSWDRRFDTDSIGAILFRQTLSGLVNNRGFVDSSFYSIPFDPNAPITTPSGLSIQGKAALLTNFADAITFINQNAIFDEEGNDLFTLDARLGDVQFTIKDGEKIEIHGGLPDTDGIYNKSESFSYGLGTLNTTRLAVANADLSLDPKTDLSSNGYQINYGSSYIMTVAFMDDGPTSNAIMTYSQSEDVDSPYFKDQTALYSNKQWRSVPFSRKSIRDSLQSVLYIHSEKKAGD